MHLNLCICFQIVTGTVIFVLRKKIKQYVDILCFITGKVIPVPMLNLTHFKKDVKSLFNAVLRETVGFLEIFH